jgi:hypothetical protein
MKMLSIVERLATYQPTPQEPSPAMRKQPENDSGHDEELNAIIREQLFTADSNLMDGEE